MSSIVFVNFPVADVQRSTEFYKKLGFQLNEEFSNEMSSALVWDEHFWIMLLNHDFYQKFIKEKKIADAKSNSTALIAFSMESAAAVKEFAEKAKENGGDYYHLDMGIPEEQMYGLEVLDLDGNQLEPTWMDV